jgi:UV radiation resistance-associated gene protein
LEIGGVEPKGKIDGNGKGKGMENVASLPFIDADVQTLRTRGLRENIKR